MEEPLKPQPNKVFVLKKPVVENPTENSEKTVVHKGIENLKPFPKGVSGNPGGRPKQTLKDYLKQKFASMSPKEKEAYLKGIPKDIQWRMAEGNPTNENNNSNTFPQAQEIESRLEQVFKLYGNEKQS